MISQVTHGIERLDPPIADRRIATGYLLDGKILVEPCVVNHTHGAEWIEWIERYGRSIEAIVLTHDHEDHTAGVSLVAAAIGVRLWTARDLALAGTIIGWTVVPTPGHAKEHVCLYRDGVLVTGDLLYGSGPTLIPRMGGDVEAYRASAAIVESLRPHLALTGHGPVIEGDSLERALHRAIHDDDTIQLVGEP